MPTYERGDMWSVFGKTYAFFITTNPIRRKDGAVVMGRGIAKQAKDRFPNLPQDFGNKIDYLKSQYDAVGNPWVPSVGSIGVYDGQVIGFFMVKDHWANDADPSVIATSVKELDAIVRDSPATFRYDLNFPGIGNGKLRRDDVLPLLEPLPDNVHIWEYET